ncbi:sensor histidine kinase [Streptomyces nodosus]|uniref:histidine kinase n=1 Tax=Streptomyces nodosus TaxID=40318 RepID=A0A0B5DKP9_9ACTN|nr:sensor histidine kinase [Streptomyces nodosus]AJE40592.1 histidine kinase [Streptomyces nodosus]MBB4791643.1 signal transduction histidine kinase [Streptomyces nodosus]QEV43222.1 sensor histidine kinase [Streptomyces nodosus]
MHATTPLPLLKRVPPGAWTVVAWCAGLVFTFIARTRLPGESEPGQYPSHLLHRWDGVTFVVLATATALNGGRLLARRPLAACVCLLLAAVLGTVPLSVGEIPMAQFLAAGVALYFVATSCPRRTARIALALALGTLVTFVAVRLFCWGVAGTSSELAVALIAVILWLLGRSAHQVRAHAERLSAQAAAQAVTTERLRIAREMHDTVAHSIGIIALQAGAATRVATTQPEAAREAMRAVETTGRETLAGLRRMLVALRAADAGHQDDPGTAAGPVSGLDDVDGLAATTTAAGVRVEVRRRGRPRPLPPDIDLSAFRIIQESVTNVVRHSGTHACRVTVDYGEDDIRLEVTDDGRGRGTSTDTGFGLAGMRERVALLHGEFHAAPRPEGGFRVAARLPVPVGVR